MYLKFKNTMLISIHVYIIERCIILCSYSQNKTMNCLSAS